mmetsp:Transcript_7123/g.22489  ORF Transcript_7123/g.22489 Transcript_7123/m.22489 type:complete len:226 (-) Transcript_7123:92-769(-)
MCSGFSNSAHAARRQKSASTTSRCAALSGARGKSTVMCTSSRPFCEGTPWCGMPSPATAIVSKGFVTPVRETGTARPSRCVIAFEKPTSASRSEIVISVCRFVPSLRKAGCGIARSVRRMSPGTCPGSCSAIRSKVSCVPSAMPFSIVASSMAASALQKSRDCTCSCCCMTKPGAICRWTIRTSGGQRTQPAQPAPSQPAVAGRWSRQPRQTTRRVTDACRVPPE